MFLPLIVPLTFIHCIVAVGVIYWLLSGPLFSLQTTFRSQTNYPRFSPSLSEYLIGLLLPLLHRSTFLDYRRKMISKQKRVARAAHVVLLSLSLLFFPQYPVVYQTVEWS